MLIYKTTINNKSYIGQTICSFKKRIKEHRYCSNHLKFNSYFYNAIRKYGWDNIKWEVLEDNIQDEQVLNERETFNILKYDTLFPIGYNMDLGGNNHFNRIVTEQTANKIREKRLGTHQSEETKKKIGDGNRNKTVSQETRLKLKAINSKNIADKNSNWKYYYQFIDNNGKKYKNITGLRTFCLNNFLNPDVVRSYLREGRNFYNGWTINKSEAIFN